MTEHLKNYAQLMQLKESQDAQIKQAKEECEKRIQAIRNMYADNSRETLEETIEKERIRIGYILESSGNREMSDEYGYAQLAVTKRWEYSEPEVIKWLLSIGRTDLLKQDLRKREFNKIIGTNTFPLGFPDASKPTIVEVIGEELRIHITKPGFDANR